MGTSLSGSYRPDLSRVEMDCFGSAWNGAGSIVQDRAKRAG